jgi:hypothetical protein
MPVLTGTEIFHSNGQTETGAETEYTTLLLSPMGAWLFAISSYSMKLCLGNGYGGTAWNGRLFGGGWLMANILL